MKAVRWWAIVVALSVGVAYAIAYGRGLSDRLDRAESDRTALAQQVRSLGGTPVAGPKGDDGMPGPAGPTGAPGPVGLNGVNGSDGSDGEAGADGAPGPSGSPGPEGAPGREGPAGSQGVPGPTGSPGIQGPAGPQGDRGPAANMCPSGYEGAIVVLEEGGGQDYFLCRKVT